MKPSDHFPFSSRLATQVGVTLATAILLGGFLGRTFAQGTPATNANAAASTGTNAPAAAAAEAAAPGTNATPALAGTNTDAQPKTGTTGTNATDEIQVSFQGANVDMIVKWLSETTGKSVVKHPRVQCQLTIVSSKKLAPREAINLVYRALALEGFNAVESANSILIVPEGQEPKMSPLLLDATQDTIPEGRQKIVKIFPLAHIQASELRDRIRGVLSDKGLAETADAANQLIVTDYNENLRLVAELIKELDIESADSTIKTYQIKFGDAEEVGNWLNLILNSPPGGTGPGARAARPAGGSSGSPGGSPTPGGDSAAAGGGSSSPPMRIWPDKAANRIIVSGPRIRFTEVERLLGVLDAEKGRDVAVRLIPLTNLTATDLAREIGPLYQRMGGRTAAREMVEVSANEASNALIVMSSEANYKAILTLVTSLDTEEAQEKTTRTFTLKNADAEDVAKQLQQLNQDQSSGNSRYVYYYSSVPSDGKSKKMNVVADRRRNSLIVQAPPNQMEGIEKTIKELDEPIGSESLAPKIFAMKYVSAVDIEDVLNELFLKKQQQRSYWDYYDDYYGSGSSSTQDKDVGRLYGKVRITSEPYSNSLIVTANNQESLDAVENVIRQLDRPSEAGESTLRISLRYAKAATVANNLNILFAKNGSPALRGGGGQPPQQGGANQPQAQQSSGTVRTGFELGQEVKEDGYYPWLGGQPDNARGTDGRTTPRQVSDLVGRVRAVADLRVNNLLVSANMQFLPQVLKLIEDMDAPTDQVLIEARLVEVSSDFMDRLGVRWSPDGSQVWTAEDYDNSILAVGTTRYQQGFGGKTEVNTPNSGAVAQTLTTLRSGVLDSGVHMDFLIQFLRKTTDASVLAEPQLNVRDNQTGRLFVGQQVPVPDNNQAYQGTQNTSIKYKDVGIVLEVTPHINSAGDVELSIHAEASTVVPGQTVLGGAVFDTRNFRTDLTAKDGQTLVVGGIIQKLINNTERKTPFLGSIPGLKWAFNKTDKTTKEVELMVFLRPRVVRTPKESRQLLDNLDRTAPLIKKWKDEMLQTDGYPADPGASPAPTAPVPEPTK